MSVRLDGADGVTEAICEYSKQVTKIPGNPKEFNFSRVLRVLAKEKRVKRVCESTSVSIGGNALESQLPGQLGVEIAAEGSVRPKGKGLCQPKAFEGPLQRPLGISLKILPFAKAFDHHVAINVRLDAAQGFLSQSKRINLTGEPTVMKEEENNEGCAG
ncbi:hypothetical protein B0H16DRAFT_1455426 [Mycena metata]|uniref:Uncharacterized protein n=1 Tax=Mycena metata TaxID=1033252 RepID=A0AAD7NI11_9AGAR|nr:hypothetical protein B0H16DRAFT_1455426 [Mycena metata]